jgi:hypothetical protein
MIHEAREWLLTTSRNKREELIGATITLLALLTASATLAGHRAHTEEVVFQTKATDQWGFYQAKHIRAHMYGMEAEKAQASSDAGMHKLTKKYLTTAIYEQCGAPAAKSCNVENCGPADDKRAKSAHPCNVPVLKDSPELEVVFKDLLSDSSFRKRFLPVSNSTSTRTGDAPGEEPAATAQKGPTGTGEPPVKKLPGAADIIEGARSHDDEVSDFNHVALRYDISEIILEISIMICGVGLVVDKEDSHAAAYFAMVVAMTVATAGVGVSLLALQFHLERGVAGVIIGAAAVAALVLIGWIILYSHERNKHRQIAAPVKP